MGVILWVATLILRDLNLATDIYLNSLLGIIPNFAVVFLAFGIGMFYYPILNNKIKIPLKKYYPYLVLITIWILVLISEYIHQILLNSPWDPFDILASGLATLIVVIIYNIYGRNN